MRSLLFLIMFVFAGCAADVTQIERDDDMMTAPRKNTDQRSRNGLSRSGTLTTRSVDKHFGLQTSVSPPGTFTLQFAINTDGVPDTLPVYCEAEISWSSGGNPITRRVSVGNGVSVTGVGEYVSVQFSDATKLMSGEPDPGKNFDYNVSVVFGPGNRATGVNPPTLVPNNPGNPALATRQNNGSTGLVAPAGASIDVDIPQNVGVTSVSVLVVNGTSTPIPQNSVLVAQANSVGNLKAYDALSYQWVPVVAGAKKIRITNNQAGQTIAFSVVFGIDG